MTAYELSCRAPQRMSAYVDIDERGAAFLALGMAKASGRPAALVCSSGTAIANYYPAIFEAESSRVPLIVLTADRPPQLQGLGAPQTCDQSHAYGTHVRAYRGMPLPADDEGSLRPPSRPRGVHRRARVVQSRAKPGSAKLLGSTLGCGGERIPSSCRSLFRNDR